MRDHCYTIISFGQSTHARKMSDSAGRNSVLSHQQWLRMLSTCQGATFLFQLLSPGTSREKGRAIDVSAELGHPGPEHTAGANPDPDGWKIFQSKAGAMEEGRDDVPRTMGFHKTSQKDAKAQGWYTEPIWSQGQPDPKSTLVVLKINRDGLRLKIPGKTQQSIS